jgi:hypothetical protein
MRARSRRRSFRGSRQSAIGSRIGRGACAESSRAASPSVSLASASDPPPQVAAQQVEANPAIEGCVRAEGRRGVRGLTERDLGVGKKPLQLFSAALGTSLDLREAEAAGAESGVELVERA